MIHFQDRKMGTAKQSEVTHHDFTPKKIPLKVRNSNDRFPTTVEKAHMPTCRSYPVVRRGVAVSLVIVMLNVCTHIVLRVSQWHSSCL